MLLKSTTQRFWSKVTIASPNECWPWKAGKTARGYGNFFWNGKWWGAHRIAWIFTSGPIPDRLQICHHCDNPACTNPRHLFLGTQSDNLKDMYRKGRRDNDWRPYGTAHANAKLTENQVVKIRERWSNGETQEAIAEDYPCSRSNVGAICRREAWRHIQ